MTKVAVIIVNWNLKADTLECLASIGHLNLKNMDFSVIVVDNGSTDGSAEAIKKKFPKVTLIEEEKNLGFTGGNNLGIDLALKNGAEFIWLLNNDTVVDKEALQELIKVFNGNVGIAGSKIYFYKDREYHNERYQPGERGRVIWYAGGMIDWQNMYGSHRGVDAVDNGQFDEIIETDFVTGCSMLVSSKIFEKTGKLDEKFYLYLEDLDFSLRAKRAGFKLMFAPKSIVWHKNAGSSAGPGSPIHEYYQTRNRLLVGFRFAPLRTKMALLREALGIVVNGPPVKRSAVIDGVTGNFGESQVWKT